MEDVSIARQIFTEGDVMCTFDLRAAYHHISIYEEHRKYLGFCFNSGKGNTYYQFDVLPFGISTAGYIFTKVLRAVVNYWREKGIKVILYLDDGIIGAESYITCQKIITEIRQDLDNLGFLMAEEKCNWIPCAKVTWLGHVLNTDGCKISITEDRIEKTIKNLNKILERVDKGNMWIQARELASVIGVIQSMKFALTFNVDLRTKYCHMCVDTKASWQSKVLMNDKVIMEIKYWLRNINVCNGQPFGKNIQCTEVAYSDASQLGYGGYMVSLDGNDTIGLWSPTEDKMSSTWREAEAVFRTLLVYKQLLRGKTVMWFCDNRNVSYILNKGSMKSSLHQIALNIENACTAYGIIIIPKWLPRTENYYRISPCISRGIYPRRNTTQAIRLIHA